MSFYNVEAKRFHFHSFCLLVCLTLSKACCKRKTRKVVDRFLTWYFQDTWESHLLYKAQLVCVCVCVCVSVCVSVCPFVLYTNPQFWADRRGTW